MYYVKIQKYVVIKKINGFKIFKIVMFTFNLIQNIFFLQIINILTYDVNIMILLDLKH